MEAQGKGITGVPCTVINQKYAISGGQKSDVYIDVRAPLRLLPLLSALTVSLTFSLLSSFSVVLLRFSRSWPLVKFPFHEWPYTSFFLSITPTLFCTLTRGVT